MSAPKVVTLGCRLNTFESEIMRSQATKAGLEDTIIINTCAVTTEAERQARQTIRRLARDNPTKRIIVTGCAAQLEPEKFAAMKEVDRVIGNFEKMNEALLELPGSEAIAVSDIMVSAQNFDVPMISGFAERTRAFVQVQQGCDHRCTFCIIPFARGPNRSIRPDRVIKQVQKLIANGHLEVVLTGVDVSSYGQDEADLPSLGSLARDILNQVSDLKRLRITSLDPAFIDDDIPALLSDDERFMPHLHLSLQAADDMILKRMKRRHNRKDAIDLVARIRQARPDVIFGADLIAGFPTETEAMFENTLNTIKQLDVTYLHVFPYSSRPGTAASKMPTLGGTLIKQRAARLRKAGEEALLSYLHTCIGETQEVLVEQGRSGHSRHFAPITLTSGAAIGTIVNARAIGVDTVKGRLIADVIR